MFLGNLPFVSAFQIAFRATEGVSLKVLSRGNFIQEIVVATFLLLAKLSYCLNTTVFEA